MRITKSDNYKYGFPSLDLETLESISLGCDSKIIFLAINTGDSAYDSCFYWCDSERTYSIL